MSKSSGNVNDLSGCGCLLILVIIAGLFAGCFGIDIDGKRHSVGCSCGAPE